MAISLEKGRDYHIHIPKSEIEFFEFWKNGIHTPESFKKFFDLGLAEIYTDVTGHKLCT